MVKSIKKVHFAALFHNGDLFAEAQISLLIKSYEVNVRLSKKLQPVCCKKQQKKVPDWMIRGITWTHMQSVWNHPGLSEVPFSANQYTVMRFSDLKETSTDTTVDSIFEKFR